MQQLEIVTAIIVIVNGTFTFYNPTDEIFWKEMAPAMQQLEMQIQQHCFTCIAEHAKKFKENPPGPTTKLELKSRVISITKARTIILLIALQT